MRLKTESNFGNWIRETIENRLQTQMQFSRESGIAYATIRGWISSDRATVSGLSRAKLCAVLKMDRSELDRLIAGFQRTYTASRAAGRSK